MRTDEQTGASPSATIIPATRHAVSCESGSMREETSVTDRWWWGMKLDNG